jgi:hypothetical protein
VGCGGTAVTYFDLHHGYDTLTTTLALDDFTPPGLMANVELVGVRDIESLDSAESLGEWELSNETRAPVSLRVSEFDRLIVATHWVGGTACGSSDLGYGVALDAWLGRSE